MARPSRLAASTTPMARRSFAQTIAVGRSGAATPSRSFMAPWNPASMSQPAWRIRPGRTGNPAASKASRWPWIRRGAAGVMLSPARNAMSRWPSSSRCVGRLPAATHLVRNHSGNAGLRAVIEAVGEHGRHAQHVERDVQGAQAHGDVHQPVHLAVQQRGHGTFVARLVQLRIHHHGDKTLGPGHGVRAGDDVAVERAGDHLVRDDSDDPANAGSAGSRRWRWACSSAWPPLPGSGPGSPWPHSRRRGRSGPATPRCGTPRRAWRRPVLWLCGSCVSSGVRYFLQST